LLFCPQSGAGDDSAIELGGIEPQLDGSALDNYHTIKALLTRMTQLCVRETGAIRKPRKHEQRLLRNMGVHVAVLDLLRIPYDKVRPDCCPMCFKTNPDNYFSYFELKFFSILSLLTFYFALMNSRIVTGVGKAWLP